MDVLKLVTEEKREIDPKDPSRSKWFAVDPDKAYPETLKFFLEAKKNKDTANQIPEHYKARVLALSDADIALAGKAERGQHRSPAGGGPRSCPAGVYGGPP